MNFGIRVKPESERTHFDFEAEAAKAVAEQLERDALAYAKITKPLAEQREREQLACFEAHRLYTQFVENMSLICIPPNR